MAKLRQECTKLTKELGEKTESLLADEQTRKGLEAKASAAEKQLSLLQVSLWEHHIIHVINYARHDQVSNVCTICKQLYSNLYFLMPVSLHKMQA